MMRCYCIIHPDGRSELIKAVTVFECDQTETVMAEAAIRFALAEKRPLSLFTHLGFQQTRFADRLPMTVSGMLFVKVNPKGEL